MNLDWNSIENSRNRMIDSLKVQSKLISSHWNRTGCKCLDDHTLRLKFTLEIESKSQSQDFPYQDR